MGDTFLKVKSESYSLLNNDTGEVSELHESFLVDEETWFRLYVNTFFGAIGRIRSAIDIKVFILCMKMSVDRPEGNMICTGDAFFKRSASEDIGLNSQNLWRSLNNLCRHGFLKKVDRSNYIINPLIAYRGDREKRAKLVLKITGVRKEL